MAERPTPCSIVICTLIAEHSDPSSSIHKLPKQSAATTTGGIVDKNNIVGDDDDNELSMEVDEHLSQVIKSLVLQTESMTLTQILNFVSGKNARYSFAAEILLNFLNESCESIDALVDLFAALRSTVARGMIDGDSAHGVYVRRRCLGFDELAFGSVGRFWESFCDYVHMANDWSKDGNFVSNVSTSKTQTSASDSMDCSLDDEDERDDGSGENNSASRHWPLAPRQISRQLFQKCLNIQKSVGSISYEAMEAQIQEILREDPELTLAHFLRFLNDALHGERVGALESFHRYFDYAMIQERKFRLSSNPLPDEVSNMNNINQSNRDSDVKQNQLSWNSSAAHYSAIILSSLYHTFARDDLAYIATREAIRIAHETSDEACLAYALGWLHAININDMNASVSSLNIQTNGYELLARASSRAAQLDISSLVVGSSLLLANQISMGSENEVVLRGIKYPVSFLPAQAWDLIATASTENALSSTMGTSAYRFDIPTHISNNAKSGEAMNTFAQQHLMGAGLWQCMGNPGLASTSYQTALRCYQAYLNSEESNIVAKEAANSALYGVGSEKSYFNEEFVDAQSLCLLVERLRLTAPVIQPTSMYQNALQKLRTNQTNQYHIASDKKWYHNIIMLLHESSLQKCDFHNASALNVLLHSCAPLTSREYAKISVELLGQRCLLFCRQRRWELAKSTICDKIIPICESSKFHYYHAFYLLQLAMIHFDSSPYDPVRALIPILSCLSIAEKFSIDGVHAEALSLLAKAHFELGDWNIAKSILNAALPKIIQNGHVSFQGETYLCMAKCILSEAKELNVDDQHINTDKKRCRLLRAAITQLHKSQAAFEKAVDIIRLREIYYLLAHCHASLPGHTSRRNEAAKKFREMNRIKLQSKIPHWYDAIDVIKGSAECE